MPLERVLEHPDEDVAPEVKARLRAQADQLDPLALQEAKERLLLQLQQTRSRAQQTAALMSEARTAPPQERQEARSGRCTSRARARGERRQERAAPSLRLSSSLRGSAQARRSKGTNAAPQVLQQRRHLAASGTKMALLR